jgi:hypothetical protein
VLPEASADEDVGVNPVWPGVGADVDDGVDAASPFQQNSWRCGNLPLTNIDFTSVSSQFTDARLLCNHQRSSQC